MGSVKALEKIQFSEEKLFYVEQKKMKTQAKKPTQK